MNYFENEFALPIILGNSKSALRAAKTLQKRTDLEIHIVGRGLSLLGRLRFYFHKLSSSSDEIVLLTIEDIVKGLDEYYLPILIYCEDDYGSFFAKNKERLESLFVTVNAKDIDNYFPRKIENEDK